MLRERPTTTQEISLRAAEAPRNEVSPTEPYAFFGRNPERPPREFQSVDVRHFSTNSRLSDIGCLMCDSLYNYGSIDRSSPAKSRSSPYRNFGPICQTPDREAVQREFFGMPRHPQPVDRQESA